MRYQYELKITETPGGKIVAHRFGALGVGDEGLLANADNLAYGLGKLGRDAAADMLLNHAFGGDHKAMTAWCREKDKAST